jgi:hypothetical protein
MKAYGNDSIGWLGWLMASCSAFLRAVSRALAFARDHDLDSRPSRTSELHFLRELRAIRHALESRRPIQLLIVHRDLTRHDRERAVRAATHQRRIEALRSHPSPAQSRAFGETVESLAQVEAELRDLVHRLADNTALKRSSALDRGELAGDLHSLGRVIAFAPRDRLTGSARADSGPLTDQDPPPVA